MTPALEFLGDLRPAFVAHLAERLTDVLCAYKPRFAHATACKAPIRTYSVLLYLLEHGPASLTEMAQMDGQSHQLLASRMKTLQKLRLIERFADAADARRRAYKLTRAGKAEALAVKADISNHARVIEVLFAETGVDLVAALDATLEALRIKPLQDRLDERSFGQR